MGYIDFTPMKYHVALILCLFILITSCHEELGPDQICNVENPTEDLPWLVALIEDLNSHEYLSQFASVWQARYISQTVFYPQSCCPNCLFESFPVYNCSGVQIGRLHFEDINPNKLKDISVIWKPENFVCPI